MYSLEPGFYKENDFGIRIEDIAVLVPVPTKVKWILLYCLLVKNPLFAVLAISFTALIIIAVDAVINLIFCVSMSINVCHMCMYTVSAYSLLIHVLSRPVWQ